MPGLVEIPEHVLDAIVAHAQAELPNECCGLLIGAGLTIHRAVGTRNLASSPTRYLVDPNDHFQAIRSARAEGLKVIGAYHSHPGSPPFPSPRDLAEAHFPDFVHVIVSVAQTGERGDVRAYRVEEGHATMLELAPRVSGRTGLRR